MNSWFNLVEVIIAPEKMNYIRVKQNTLHEHAVKMPSLMLGDVIRQSSGKDLNSAFGIN